MSKDLCNGFKKQDFNEKFLLLCGFEKFKDFFVRIDILEKLFITIIEKTVKRYPEQYFWFHRRWKTKQD